MIELHNISKYYENKGLKETIPVLENISFKVEAGDSVAIVGPSGSGKSTLLNIIGTLDNPSSGDVMINGVNIKSLNEKEISAIRNKNIGFIFQRHYLLPQLNILENILLPALPLRNKINQKKTLERALELLDKVEIPDKAYHLPGQLSVGQCQRAAVVRALINEPEILLADEPTGSLDNKSALALGELLLSINRIISCALVIVTHSYELADKMNIKYKLFGGKLLIDC